MSEVGPTMIAVRSIGNDGGLMTRLSAAEVFTPTSYPTDTYVPEPDQLWDRRLVRRAAWFGMLERAAEGDGA